MVMKMSYSTTDSKSKMNLPRQHYDCHDCGQYSMEDDQTQYIPLVIRQLVDRFLEEQLAFTHITRVTGVPEPWLKQYIHTYPSD